MVTVELNAYWGIGAILGILIAILLYMIFAQNRRMKETTKDDPLSVPSVDDLQASIKSLEQESITTVSEEKKADKKAPAKKKQKKDDRDDDIDVMYRQEIMDHLQQTYGTIENGYIPCKPVRYGAQTARFSFRKIKDWYFNKYQTARVLQINMELINGFHKRFLVLESDDSFLFKGKRYVIDHTQKYFIVDDKMWALDYHESFTNPIERKLPVGDIKEILESPNMSEVEYATNPKTLQRFIISKVAEGIMRGQALDDFLRQVRLMIILILCIVAGHFLYILIKTGAFEQVQNIV